MYTGTTSQSEQQKMTRAVYLTVKIVILQGEKYLKLCITYISTI
jgi:hypothetical protein